MDYLQRTPLKGRKAIHSSVDLCTPPMQASLSRELQSVLNERNLLTAKSRRQVCSMLDNLGQNELNEFDKRMSLRRQAIREILTSECSYIQQLELLVTYFVNPLKDRTIITPVSHNALFGQIEMIYNLNLELRKELEVDLNNVAVAFLKMAPFFKLYSVYAFDYRNALLVLQDLTNKNSAFRKFLENTESRPEVTRKLQSLLIVPIQRIPRYRLLLQQVLLYTSPSDAEFKILQESVKQVENTVSHIDSCIEDQEITQILLNLQNSLVYRTPNIVKPSRKIIKEGILMKMSSNGTKLKRYCILMSDIFMYCKLLKDRTKKTLVENSLQCCCIFPLKKCKVSEFFPGNFKITCQGDGAIFCTDDLRAGQTWVAAIRETIELHIQCRKTLRKESSKRTPMRRKDIKNFGNEEISSPRKCDYETIFRLDTSDNDNKNVNISNWLGRMQFYKKRKTFSNDQEVVNKKQKLETNSKRFCIKNLLRSKRTSSEEEQVIDPSYGFVDYSVRRNFGFVMTKKASEDNVQDILYPLRSSNGSNKSNLSRNAEIKKELASASCKKRVQFDENSPQKYPIYSTKPFKFPVYRLASDGETLRQRITKFFRNLF